MSEKFGLDWHNMDYKRIESFKIVMNAISEKQRKEADKANNKNKNLSNKYGR